MGTHIATILCTLRYISGKAAAAAEGLAVPPPNGCSRADQEVVVCQPVEVALITATVYDGKLVVFECGVDRAQWKNFGRQLRTMRSSFSTTEPLSS